MILKLPDINGNNKKLDMRELGASGLEHYSGFIFEEFLSQLKGDRKIKVFKEMRDNDPIVGGILFAIEKLIRQVDWKVEPFSDEQEDIEKADFLESNMQDMTLTWEELISEILSMLVFGWSFFEIVYKKRLGENREDPDKSSRFKDGLIGWEKISIRSQDTHYKWIFDDNGNIKALQQIPPPKFDIRTIPMDKGLLFRTTSHKNNPEGRSILRNSYRPWFFKKNIESIEGIGIERDLAGLPVAYVPPEIMDSEASSEEKRIYNKIKEIVTNIRRDEQEGIVFPQIFDENGNKQYDLELMSSGGQRQFNTSEIIERYDKRIAMTVMADFILLGQDGTGSYALSEDKTDLFVTAIKTWLDSIAAVFNRKAVEKLFKINGFDLERLPKIQPEKIRRVNLEDLSQYINNLAGAGAPLFPDQELENHLRGLADLPLRGEGQHGMENF